MSRNIAPYTFWFVFKMSKAFSVSLKEWHMRIINKFDCDLQEKITITCKGLVLNWTLVL